MYVESGDFFVFVQFYYKIRTQSILRDKRDGARQV